MSLRPFTFIFLLFAAFFAMPAQAAHCAQETVAAWDTGPDQAHDEAAHAHELAHGDGGSLAAAGHSHAPGSELLHQAMFHHHSADAAQEAVPVVPPCTVREAENEAPGVRLLSGISVLPPVPPPLA